MTDASAQPPGRMLPAFCLALIANAVWINALEVWRYFAVVRPMLHEAFPSNDGIAPVTPAIFASWMVWDAILVLSATGFYWLYFRWAGPSYGQALLAASYFTLTVFGLLWLGVINMGLAPVHLLWPALPLAWVEQAVAALIVRWALKRERR